MPLADLAAALFQCTNLEHIRVVPAFAQCGVRENETHRRLFRITIQKQFLVLHNQVIGVNIVGRTLLLVGELAVGHFALLINGEVTGVGVMGRNRVQVADVVLVPNFPLHGAENVVVLFLEHIRINAVERMSSLVVLLVLRNLVDEEQGQDFDALMEKLTFPLQVRKNRLADLNAAKLVFADLADHITGKDFDAVQELHRVVASVDRFHHKADFVLVQITGIVVKIITDSDRRCFLANAGRALVIKLDGCRRVCFGKIDAFQIDEAIGCCAAGLRDAFNGDLLDQPLIVRFHRVKAIDHVINAVRLVGCRVSQRQQRAKLFQPFFCLLALDRLRLVDNQNWVRLCNDVNRATGTELVQLHVNAPRVLALGIERLRVDNHNVYGAIRRKAVNFRELGRIVDEEPDLLAVFLRKMLLRHLKGLINALADGDARHDHDELAPTIVLVQFIHGLDVGIGLADAGFHFNRQIITTFQLVRRLDLIGALHLLQMFQNQLVGKLRHNTFIPPTCKIRIILQANLIVSITAVHHICRREVRLSGKDVNDCFCCICLKFLMFELEFHVFSLLIISSLSFRTILSSKVGKGSFAFVIPPVNTRFSTAINGKNPALLRELIDSFNENAITTR